MIVFKHAEYMFVLPDRGVNVLERLDGVILAAELFVDPIQALGPFLGPDSPFR